MNEPQRACAGFLGIGLDGDDGHVRVTRAEHFHLIGGSHQTHGQMQDSCIRFNEKLKLRGKRLDDLEPRELMDLAAECGMNVAMRPPRPGREA